MASTEEPAATPEKSKSTKKKRKTAARASKKQSSTTRKASTPSAAPKRKRSTRRTTGAKPNNPATVPAATEPIRTEAPAGPPISPLARQRMIAEAAYYKAESRGFAGGNPERDWLEAEAEIDGRLTR